ncbi:MAG: hypothetical protein KatS3mg030_026 [Saprospiraceae bacterium]|nr:MAG: hypothetical protein KatS3mg030_026 [Saprospiraceae bacterium]
MPERFMGGLGQVGPILQTAWRLIQGCEIDEAFSPCIFKKLRQRLRGIGECISPLAKAVQQIFSILPKPEIRHAAPYDTIHICSQQVRSNGFI